jgi:SOS response regulatory protein OraA/RecX
MAEREDAVQTALRALRFRDRTSAELAARLERRGVGEAEREEALELLERIGYVDDARFARSRAEQLAARAAGNELIRHDLEQRGVPADQVEVALADLDPERDRAAAIVAARGHSARTARYLASRGFGEEAVEWVIARDG